MKLIFSKEFKKSFQKINDQKVRLKIIKQIKKLSENTMLGKPLKYSLKNHRSIRILPHRIVYRIYKECIVINCFDHRKDMYD